MKKVLLLLALTFYGTFAFSEVAISKIAKECDADFYIDYWRDICYLSKDEVSLTFGIDSTFLLENYSKKIEVDYIGLGKDGEVVAGEIAAKKMAMLLNSSTQEQMQQVSTIILDAGHGGQDSGAVSPFNVDKKRLAEKDVVLDIALKVYANLKKAYPAKKIILTRSNDTFLTLEQRTTLANGVKIAENESILFISLHANASLRESASGFEVWYLPPDVKRNMLTSPIMENLSEKSVAHILNGLLDEETTVESIKLADYILRGMESKIGTRSLNRGLKEEAWFVVRNAKMPSVLIEVGFVSNKKEAALLNSSAYRNDIGMGIFNGICQFVSQFEQSNGFTKQKN